jgi:hypothetical protein
MIEIVIFAAIVLFAGILFAVAMLALVGWVKNGRWW